jgi:hypothetical protein
MRLPVYLDYSATTPGRSAGGREDDSLTHRTFRQSCLAFASSMAGTPRRPWRKRVTRWRAGGCRFQGNHLDLGGDRIEQPGDQGGRTSTPTKGKHIITVSTEHKAVLDTVKELERQGFEATYLTPQENGLITTRTVQAGLASGHRAGLGDGGQQRDWGSSSPSRNSARSVARKA